jgi:methenyltetrahydrofolate cyclohydrolase
MNDMPRRFSDLTVGEFVDLLATAEPVPGGGSASAIVAAFSAALVAMVARLSLGREKYAAYSATIERAEELGARESRHFLELSDRDAAAFAQFAAALKLPRATADEQEGRAVLIRAAARDAASVPMEVVEACWSLAQAVEAIAGRSNLNASSDVEVAALLVGAAAHGAAANVFVNLPMVKDERFESVMTAELVLHLSEIDDLAARAREFAAGGKLRDPEEA